MADYNFYRPPVLASDDVDETPTHAIHEKHEVTLVQDDRLRYWCVTCGREFFGPRSVREV